jgi:hypothetical protein
MTPLNPRRAMKLADLEARFVDHRVELADEHHGRPMPDGTVQWGGFPVDTLHYQQALPGAEGVTFLCPKCFQQNGGSKGTHSVMVFFEGADLPPDIGRNGRGETVRWHAAGTGIDDLTLSPSIQLLGGCAWHGIVGNGETRDA